MLQRLVIKPPSPLKSYPNDYTIFTKEGKLRENYYKLCQELHINPDELNPRTLESFQDKNDPVPQNVQILRYNNYENKRRAKIEALRALAKQRNINVAIATRPARPGTTSSRPRQISLNSLNNLDGFRGIRESHSSLPKYSSQFADKTVQIKAENRIISDSSSNLSGGLANRLNETRDSPIRKTNGSLSNIDMDLDECDMDNGLEAKLQRYLAYKKIERERLLNASVLVTKHDEEHREQMKKAYEEKLKKWAKKREEMEKKKKAEKKDDHKDEITKENIAKQKQMIRENQKATYQKMIQRITNSEMRKKEELDKKIYRLMGLNNTFQERYMSSIKKREEEMSFYVEDTLANMEKKFKVIDNRKRRFVEKKKIDALKHSEGVDEKILKAHEDEREKEHMKLQKLLEKMEKSNIVQKRSQSVVLSKRREEKVKKMLDEQNELLMRMEEKAMKDTLTEKQKIEALKKKEKRIKEKLDSKRSDLSDFIAERRELWSQKRENIQENKEIAREAREKYVEQQMRSYKQKIDFVQRIKEERRKQLVNNQINLLL